MKENENRMITVPLAAFVSLSELSGWFSKYLEVPNGRKGIVYSTSKTTRILKPGRHKVRKLGERFTKGKPNIVCGFIPENQFSVSITAPYLTTRDSFLVDMDLLCRVNINQAEKFFIKEVVPLGEISDEPYVFDEVAARKIFNAITSQHYRSDLVRNYSIDRLIEILFPALPGFLNDRGLQLLSVDIVSFTHSDKERETLRKAQILKEEFDQVEMEETKTGESQFMGTLPNLPEGVRLGKKHDKKMLQSIKNFAQDDGRRHSNKHLGLWERAFGISRDQEVVEYKWLPQFWWLGRTSWILLLLGVGAALTYIAIQLGEDMDSGDVWNFILIGVWGVIIPLVLDSFRKLIDKREKLAEIRWLAPGSIYLYDLIHKNRNKADSVVRKHCSDELAKSVDVLHDLRSRVFKTGNNDLSLHIRTLERKLNDSIDQVKSEKFGQPAYLNDLHIPNKAWHVMLDYDENLMLYTNAIFDNTTLAQLSYPDVDLDENKLINLEHQLDLFMAKFAARSRVVKA